MNFRRLMLSLAFLSALLFALPGEAAGGDGLGLSAGARYHTDHSAFEDLPYGTGDVSCMLAMEYAERIALWQFGVDIAPYLSGSREVDPDNPDEKKPDPKFAASPQLNLIFRDRMFRGGTGIMGSYVRDDEGNGDWIGPYWQLLLGLSFDLSGSLSLDTNAHYVMKNWDKIIDFSFSDLEYSMLLTFRF